MSSHPPAARLLPCVIAFAALSMTGLATATTVRQMSTDQVDQLAARIFEGRCVEIRRADPRPGAPAATEFRFLVERWIKGESGDAAKAGSILVVRQIGGPAVPEGSMQILGVPVYEVGKRYRLALNGESSLGLTSPVGLGQGVTVLPETGEIKDASPVATEAKP